MSTDRHQRGWRQLPLGNAAEVTMGSSPPGESYNDEGKGVPLVNGPVEFSEGDFGFTIQGKYTTEPTRICRTGDLLLCVRGSTTGRTNIAGFDACIGRGVASIRAREDQRFLNHFIRTQRQRLFALGNGSTFPSITQEQLVSLQVPLPPLPEQKRIADILDKADAIRRKRREAIDSTRILADALFLTFVNRSNYDKGWESCDLQDVLYFQEGPGVRNWQFTSSGVKLLNVKNLVDGRLVLDNTERFISEDEAYGKYAHFLAEAGDLVMATSGVTWGKTAWVESHHLPLCMNTSTVRFRPLSDRITKGYMHAFLNSHLFSRQIDRLVTGSAQPNFGPSHLKRVTIPVPPVSEQRQFVSQLERLSSATGHVSNALTEADSLFNSLVQRAFRGDL